MIAADDWKLFLRARAIREVYQTIFEIASG
jgi:hypothetical protein